MQCLNPDQAFGLMHMLPKDKILTSPSKVYKERKKHDRFNGMPEEEVSKRTLPDHLSNNLDIVIVSKNLSFILWNMFYCLNMLFIKYVLSKLKIMLYVYL